MDVCCEMKLYFKEKMLPFFGVPVDNTVCFNFHFVLSDSVIEKEFLAVHWGINFFRIYIYGRRLTAITDHQPLLSLWRRCSVEPLSED